MKVDDKLLKLAAKYNGILITNDVYLKVKCLISQVKTKGYGGTEEYSGILYWDIELDENKYNADLEKLLESKTTMGTNENQYIIVRDLATKEILSTLNDIKALLETLVDGNTKKLSEANLVAKETLQNVARTVNQGLASFKKSL